MSKLPNFRGKVCKSSNGDLGVVRKLKSYDNVLVWEGVGFNGHFWRSRHPIVVANCINDYIDALLKKDQPVVSLEISGGKWK